MAITKRGDVLPWKDKFWEKIYDGKYNQILWSLNYLSIDSNDMLVEYPIDEELSRVRELIESLAN
jgi:hypothetical protein